MPARHRPVAPSPHAAQSCLSTCEPALRDFIAKTSHTQRRVSESRAALDRFAAMCASGRATSADGSRLALEVAEHLERLEAELKGMQTEITALRDTTIREMYRHCAPAHHPIVTGLGHLVVRPPIDPPLARCPPDHQ